MALNAAALAKADDVNVAFTSTLRARISVASQEDSPPRRSTVAQTLRGLSTVEVDGRTEEALRRSRRSTVAQRRLSAVEVDGRAEKTLRRRGQRLRRENSPQ